MQAAPALFFFDLSNARWRKLVRGALVMVQCLCGIGILDRTGHRETFQFDTDLQQRLLWRTLTRQAHSRRNTENR